MKAAAHHQIAITLLDDGTLPIEKLTDQLLSGFCREAIEVQALVRTRATLKDEVVRRIVLVLPIRHMKWLTCVRIAKLQVQLPFAANGNQAPDEQIPKSLLEGRRAEARQAS